MKSLGMEKAKTTLIDSRLLCFWYQFESRKLDSTNIALVIAVQASWFVYAICVPSSNRNTMGHGGVLIGRLVIQIR